MIISFVIEFKKQFKNKMKYSSTSDGIFHGE